MKVDLISLVEIQLNTSVTPYYYSHRDISFRDKEVLLVSHNYTNKLIRTRKQCGVNTAIIATLSQSVVAIGLDLTELGY